MKKLLICLALAFSLVTLGACGKNESAKPTSSTNNHQSKGCLLYTSPSPRDS